MAERIAPPHASIEGIVQSVLVTGGAGFIGSNYVRWLLARTAARVVVLDKLTYAGNPASLADVAGDPRVVFVRGDIGDRAVVDDLLRAHRPTAVVNFAAETHVVGAFELLEAARRHVAGLEPGEAGRFRFLHVSTDEVYGSLGAAGAF